MGRWYLAAFLCLLGARACAESEFVVTAILSQNEVPYQQALQGIREVLERQYSTIELDVEIFADARKQYIKDAVRARNSRVIVPLGAKATEFAVTEFKSIPVCAGLIVNELPLNQAPNATAVTLSFSFAVQIDWFKRFIHQQTVAVLYNPDHQNEEFLRFQSLARHQQVKIFPQPVRDIAELAAVLNKIPAEVGVLWSFANAGILNAQTAKQVLLFSFRNRIPLVGLSSQWTKAGALYSLDRDYVDIGKQCGEKIQQILQGTPVQHIPVDPPRKIVYSINRKTAQHMKLELSEDLLRGAYEIY